VGYYADIDRVIAKYPHDPRRVEQLMGEVGFAKGGDGLFTSPATGRFTPELQGTAEGQEGQETTIVANLMRQNGIDVSLALLSAAQRDASDELKATYPGLSSNNATLDRDPGLNKFHSLTLATPANRWSGSNKMGWSNAAFDRLRDAWGAALDASQRDRIMVQIAKLIGDEAPVVPLYFNYGIVVHANALAGPRVRAPGGTAHANVHEWQWR
jgi:ABC-type transport system substrate-binding protein